MPEARLAELAQRHGIELGYHDIWGTWHEARDETLRGLLSALHIDVSTPGKLEAAIAAHEREQRTQILPPVAVIRDSQLGEGVRIQLAPSLGDRKLQWRVVHESGQVAGGELETRNLPELERYDFDGASWRALALPLPAALAPGYHALSVVDATAAVATMSLIVVPERCYEPQAIADDGRVWGGALQLYALRSERNWGIGDYSDLRACIEQWAAQGAAVMGVNPLHALFLDDPSHASPYSPSSRLFLNVLYLDIEAMDDFRESTAAREAARGPEMIMQLKRLRADVLVDYAGVAAAKRTVLEILFAHFDRSHLRHDTPRARQFRDFCMARGPALRRYALFEALQVHFRRTDPSIWRWHQWPQEYRDPDSPAVAEFERSHAADIEFHQYLQWQADLQLSAVEERCFELGLGIGLYTDLAVSIDRGGADAWANQMLYAVGASIGAPPDPFAMQGQDWGLPPLVPERLRACGYAPFIETLRANMARAGALRIDHVMGLARIFCVPPGMRPANGAYIRYPFEDMLGIVALESHRNRCMVIGEDLGTVPDAVRHGLQRAGVLSYRLLMFEREHNGQARPPSAYPRQALAACTTHDLPTMAGYWRGEDVLERERLGLIPDQARLDQLIVERAQERTALLLALEREGLLPPGTSVNPAAMPEATPEFLTALHVYLARSSAAVMVVQLEDVLGVIHQPNLPGTVDQYPNWRRKLPLPLEQWTEDSRFRRLADAMRALRGRTQTARPRARLSRTTPRIPRATYRLQLHRGFTLRDATALLPYLQQLGISHVYCSPWLRARSGSTHGYDIIDHQTLNPEIGSREDFEAFVAALRRHGMGQMADIVPNHMGVLGADNAWWLEVLENGPATPYAEFFDIDWQPVRPDLVDRVLLPVLGDHYGTVLSRGELGLHFEPVDGSFSVRYYAHRFPIDPREYPRILERAASTLSATELPADTAAEFKSLISAFGYLPARSERMHDRVAERSANKEVHKRRLAHFAANYPAIAAGIESATRSLNGKPGDAPSFDALHELLEAQAYRLAYWRVAADDINYRRFFDINDLAALRMENEAVFEATHRLVFDFVHAGAIDALRIDHPDGLFDPGAYFRRLQGRYQQLHGDPASEGRGPPLYVLIEKIIAPFENLPENWAVYGTTGYRFANLVNGLFVDSAAEARFTRTYQSFTGIYEPYVELAVRAKLLILHTALASELSVLANRLARIARANRDTRDYTLNTLRQTLAEIIASFPVYRTYVADEVSEADRRYIDWAVARAKRHTRAADSSIFDFVKAVLLGEAARPDQPRLADAMKLFARKFQQLTAPVMAKGVEDTAFYIYNRLVSLNDVGGDPATFGYTVSAFHGASADRAARWPHTMLATSTHDNKRSEDVRARIDVLSELAPAWRLQLQRWSRMNRSKKREVEGEPAPSYNDEYMLYQVLIGTFPATPVGAADLAAYRERLENYMLKAVREAKLSSSWVNPNSDYEAAVSQFVRALLAPDRNLFLEDFRNSIPPLAWLGMLNSLSMALIKYTSPGVPDCYQGNEMLDFSLVDPDNRRPVDYDRRRAALEQLAAMAEDEAALPKRLQALFATAHDGRIKLYLIWRLLQLRRVHSDLFTRGGYTPLQTTGAHAAHVVAYARRHRGQGIIALAARMYAALGVQTNVVPCGSEFWRDTFVEVPFLAPGTELRDAVTGLTHRFSAARMPLAELFSHFPGAVLHYQRGETT